MFVAFLLRIASFSSHEACGQCVPCRVGVVRQQEALEHLAAGKPFGSVARKITGLREMAQPLPSEPRNRD